MIMGSPNFRGQRALVLLPRDRNREAVGAQLERLGLFVAVRWPAEAVSAENSDVVFFDADTGFDGLFDWRPGRASVPLIAVLGSEAPGRIAWTLAQRPSAYLMKPVGSAGVFTALTIAFHTFALQCEDAVERRALEERLELRDTVITAAATLMRRCNVDAVAALRMLRRESMHRRSPIDAISALVLAGKWLPPPELSKGEDSNRARSA